MFSEQNKVLELILDILYTKTFLPTFHFFNGRKAVAERKISEGWDGPSFFLTEKEGTTNRKQTCFSIDFKPS